LTYGDRLADRVSAERGGPRRPSASRWASRVGWLCLDIPDDAYDAECGFWAGLTGWELAQGPDQEFRELTVPAGFPLRLLLQRTGDLAGTPARAHPDLACSGVGEERARHERLGATWSHDGASWVTMRDPAGLEYCIAGSAAETVRPR
jgi:hypothetical protein